MYLVSGLMTDLGWECWSHQGHSIGPLEKTIHFHDSASVHRGVFCVWELANYNNGYLTEILQGGPGAKQLLTMRENPGEVMFFKFLNFYLVINFVHLTIFELIG